MPGAPDVIVGTFSKSFASVGGFISGSDEVIQYMEFFA
jgi:7-keto-8-aminopelargonate synthetase-like enzyme